MLRSEVGEDFGAAERRDDAIAFGEGEAGRFETEAGGGTGDCGMCLVYTRSKRMEERRRTEPDARRHG